MKRIGVLLFFMLTCIAFSGCKVQINPTSDIQVWQDTTEFISDISVYDFGKILVGESSTEVEFTILNTGKAKLNFTDEFNPIAISDDTVGFTIEQSSMVSVLETDESTSFTISFTPENEGEVSATIIIHSNDYDEEPFQFVIKGEGVVPDINVKQGSTNIPSGSGNHNFGVIAVGKMTPKIVFTIENVGSGMLELTGGSELVTISGPDASMFTLTQSATTPSLDAGGSTTFSIMFMPTNNGVKSATISIDNTDTDENPYTFMLSGEGVDEPEINVIDPDGKTIVSGSGIYDFGEVLHGEIPSAVFEIENIGTETLNLTGSSLIEINGAGSDAFAVTTTPSSSIDSGFSATFTIEFEPTDRQVYEATVSIANNDKDENPYTFTISGEGVAPEINVRQDSTDIESGSGVYDFGNVVSETPSPEITFTIENIGAGEINLTATGDKIEISGPDAALFAINQSSVTTPLTNGSPTTFTIVFTPMDDSPATATISIANDDTDENPYTFDVTGTGIYVPEINVQNSRHQDVPSGSGTYDMGQVLVNTSRFALFFVQNLGKASLELNGTPIIDFTGTDSSAFSTIILPPPTIIPGGSNLFAIRFGPLIRKQYSVTVSIKNNDSDENPYTFTISGEGVAPEIEVYDSTPILIPHSTGNYDFGKVKLRSTVETTFTIKNVGDGPLALTSPDLVEITGVDAGTFNVKLKPSQNVVMPGKPQSFTIEYHPLTVKHFKATISIANSDQDENPYTFGIEGSALPPQKGSDFNGDGYMDVLVSSPNENEGGVNAGALYIFFGSSSWNSEIDASNASVKIIGEDTRDYFGCSHSSAGDVNNDGIDDIIVAAKNDDDGGDSSGCVFIFFGRNNWTSQIDASNADVKLIGEGASDNLGSVSQLGDVNGDGIDDVIVSAGQGLDNGVVKGCAYIFFGKQNWSSSINVSNADVKLTGENYWDSFSILAKAGDVNGDGLNDVIVGAGRADFNGGEQGRVYIFFGRQNWTSLISASAANVIIIGENKGDWFSNVGHAGDVNNDGFSDIIVGASSYQINGAPEYGANYVFYGRSIWSAQLSASNADVKIVGEAERDQFGRGIIEDINNDGFGDIIVGASQAHNNGTGKTYIFFGSGSLSSSLQASNANVIISGNDNRDSFSFVSSVGDINNDGTPDIVVGAHGDDDGGNFSGCAFIFHGRQNWSSVKTASDADVKMVGEIDRDVFGICVSGCR